MGYYPMIRLCKNSELQDACVVCRLPKQTWAKISQIRTLSVERIAEKLGHVSQQELDQIIEGLNEIIG